MARIGQTEIPIFVIEGASATAKTPLANAVRAHLNELGAKAIVLEQPVDTLYPGGEPIMFGSLPFRQAFKSGYFSVGKSVAERKWAETIAITENRAWLYNDYLAEPERYGGEKLISGRSLVVMVRDRLSTLDFQGFVRGGVQTTRKREFMELCRAKNLPSVDSTLVIHPGNIGEMILRQKRKERTGDLDAFDHLDQGTIANGYLELASQHQRMNRDGISNTLFSMPSAGIEGAEAQVAETMVFLWAYSQALMLMPSLREDAGNMVDFVKIDPSRGRMRIKLGQLFSKIEGGEILPNDIAQLSGGLSGEGAWMTLSMYVERPVARRDHAVIRLLSNLMMGGRTSISAPWGDLKLTVTAKDPPYTGTFLWSQGKYARKVLSDLKT